MIVLQGLPLGSVEFRQVGEFVPFCCTYRTKSPSLHELSDWEDCSTDRENNARAWSIRKEVAEIINPFDHDDKPITTDRGKGIGGFLVT